MKQLALWTSRRRQTGRRVLRCDDCGRAVHAAEALRVCPDGKRRGDKCRRKYNRARRRLVLSPMIPIRWWRDIPGQLDLTDSEGHDP